MIVAVIDARLGGAFRAVDLFSFFDIIGGRSNALLDERPVVIEIYRTSEFDRVNGDPSHINVGEEPQVFFAIA